MAQAIAFGITFADAHAALFRQPCQSPAVEQAHGPGGIAFLLDETKSSFITGQTLNVDGGFTAGGLIGL